jgi:Flp pilus assembly protein TadG
VLKLPAPLGALGRRLRRSRRRAVAAIEFAFVAPVGVTLMIGVFDLVRGFVIWEQTCNAAEAIAEAAEKLSVTTGSIATSLTATQMQNAMSTVYAQVPGLSLGNGDTASGSSFTVTLSSVVYSPTCTTTTGCATQTPYTAWSTYLTQSGVTLTNPPLRACGTLTEVASFPDDSTQLSKMAYWSSGSIPLTPQVVADVKSYFVPMFSMFTGPVTFWASATEPTPLGGTNQAISFNATSPTGNVQTCTVP